MRKLARQCYALKCRTEGRFGRHQLNTEHAGDYKQTMATGREPFQSPTRTMNIRCLEGCKAQTALETALAHRARTMMAATATAIQDWLSTKLEMRAWHQRVLRTLTSTKIKKAKVHLPVCATTGIR